MNEQHDHHVIDRLRAALDEVTVGVNAAGASSPAVAVPRRVGLSAARWLAIASAAALVVVAVAATVVNRTHRGESAATPVTTSPATVPASSQPVLGGGTPGYVLAAQDLVPGGVQVEPCCPTIPAGGAPLAMVWARSTGLTDGMLLLTEVLDGAGDVVATTAPGTTTRSVEGGTLVFTSYGLSDSERDALAQEVVPGSGLPYVLPADGWQNLAMGRQNAGALRTQRYANDQGTVSLSVGEYRGQLAELAATDSTITEVTVAGNAGWMVTDQTGTVVVWPAADSGQWALMTVPPAMADRVHGLIAAVGEINRNSTATSIASPNSPPHSAPHGEAPTSSSEHRTEPRLP